VCSLQTVVGALEEASPLLARPNVWISESIIFTKKKKN
jgi:hypothetical protein